jgi:hypothetical protein
MTQPLFCTADQPVLNFLSPINFQFFIKKCPRVDFFVTSVNLPGLSMASPEQATPFINIPHAGDHINYSELVVSFKVDEQLVNYLEIDSWLTSLGFPENYDQYKKLADKPLISAEGLKSDATLLILDSNKNASVECLFTEAFPISLSDIQFDVAQTDVNYVEATATFQYINRIISKVN